MSAVMEPLLCGSATPAQLTDGRLTRGCGAGGVHAGFGLGVPGVVPGAVEHGFPGDGTGVVVVVVVVVVAGGTVVVDVVLGGVGDGAIGPTHGTPVSHGTLRLASHGLPPAYGSCVGSLYWSSFMPLPHGCPVAAIVCPVRHSLSLTVCMQSTGTALPLPSTA